MNTLQFIDSMTGRLAWPIAAFALGCLFRVSIRSLIDRLRKLSIGGMAADLAETALAQAEADVEEAVEEAAVEPEQGDEEDERVRRARIERLVQHGAVVGFTYGQARPEATAPPKIAITWHHGQPYVDTYASAEHDLLATVRANAHLRAQSRLRASGRVKPKGEADLP